MTQCTELWVDLKQLSKTRVVTDELPPLEDGEVLVAIDKFGITTMNLQYARARPNVSYWGFPRQGEWCNVQQSRPGAMLMCLSPTVPRCRKRTTDTGGQRLNQKCCVQMDKG